MISAYTLTIAAALLAAGALADVFGRRRLFLAGLVLFALASVACTLAPTAIVLVLARGVQGLAGAFILSSALALLANEYDGEARARALGIWGASVALAFAVGPLEGGALTELVSWRAPFALLALLSVLLLGLGLRSLRETRGEEVRRVDWAGAAALGTALFLLVFALIQGNALGWASPLILASVAVAVVSLAGFVVLERRRAEPLVDLGLFGSPTFAGASLVVLLLGAATFGPILYTTLFLLNVQDRSPLVAGIVLLPFAAVGVVVSLFEGKLLERIPIRLVLGGGMLVAAVGLVLLSFVDRDSGWVSLVPGLLLTGAGAGLANPATTFAHLGVASTERSGMASGVNNTFRQLGVAFGIAALGAILQLRVHSGVLERMASVPLGGIDRQGVADRLADGDLARALRGVSPSVRPRLERAYDGAFTGALGELLLIGAGLSLLAAVAALLLVRQTDLAAVQDPTL